MGLDKKILSELERYHSINKYITEQDAPIDPEAEALPPTPEAGAAPDAGAGAIPGLPAPEAGGGTEPIDVNTDDEVEKIDDEGSSMEDKGGDSEELEITDLVSSQENIEKKQDDYFNNLFQQLTNLEGKLGEMDSILSRLNAIETKIEKYREKTPEEKLELRTYDSYPFNQKLSDFFDDKKVEMEKTGKHDYVLTTDDVTDVTDNELKKTFLPPLDDEDQFS